MEYEAKFQLPHLAEIRKRIITIGGRLAQERMLERNLRFEDPGRTLTASHQVVRLRQDCEVTLTYKRGVESFESRVEIELQVSDFKQACLFLKALGFTVLHEYEKYRETFLVGSAQIMLDELPFGYFVEVECESLKAVEQMAAKLGFIWENRVQTPYLEMFNRLRDQFDFEFDDATFGRFEQLDQLTRDQVSASLRKHHSQLE